MRNNPLPLKERGNSTDCRPVVNEKLLSEETYKRNPYFRLARPAASSDRSLAQVVDPASAGTYADAHPTVNRQYRHLIGVHRGLEKIAPGQLAR